MDMLRYAPLLYFLELLMELYYLSCYLLTGQIEITTKTEDRGKIILPLERTRYSKRWSLAVNVLKKFTLLHLAHMSLACPEVDPPAYQGNTPISVGGNVFELEGRTIGLLLAWETHFIAVSQFLLPVLQFTGCDDTSEHLQVREYEGTEWVLCPWVEGNSRDCWIGLVERNIVESCMPACWEKSDQGTVLHKITPPWGRLSTCSMGFTIPLEDSWGKLKTCALWTSAKRPRC